MSDVIDRVYTYVPWLIKANNPILRSMAWRSRLEHLANRWSRSIEMPHNHLIRQGSYSSWVWCVVLCVGYTAGLSCWGRTEQWFQLINCPVYLYSPHVWHACTILQPQIMPIHNMTATEAINRRCVINKIDFVFLPFLPRKAYRNLYGSLSWKFRF